MQLLFQDGGGDTHLQNSPSFAVNPERHSYFQHLWRSFCNPVQSGYLFRSGESGRDQRIGVNLAKFAVEVVSQHLAGLVGDKGAGYHQARIVHDLFDEVIQQSPFFNHPHLFIQQRIDDRRRKRGDNLLSLALQVVVQQITLVLPCPPTPQCRGDRHQQHGDHHKLELDTDKAPLDHLWHPKPHPLGMSRIMSNIFR